MPKNMDSSTLETKIFELNKLYLRSNSLWHKCEQVLGINHSMSNVLYFLHTFSNATQKQIAQSSNMPKQTIHNVILGLHKQGFVELRESPNDKREKLISLTQEGKEFADTLLKPLLAVNQSVFLRMGSKKVESLFKSWQEFNKAFSAELQELTNATQNGDKEHE